MKKLIALSTVCSMVALIFAVSYADSSDPIGKQILNIYPKADTTGTANSQPLNVIRCDSQTASEMSHKTTVCPSQLTLLSSP